MWFLLFSRKVFLEHRGKDEVGQLVGAKTHGATPLVMACRNGHYDVAEYLIEKCGADVEQPGSGKTTVIFSLTALFYPSTENNLQIELRKSNVWQKNLSKNFYFHLFF